MLRILTDDSKESCQICAVLIPNWGFEDLSKERKDIQDL